MRVIVLLSAMIALTVIANLTLKLGAEDPPAPLLLGVYSWRTIAGFAAFAAAGLVYAKVLQYLPLNVAQSYATAQFVAVIVSSRLFLGEPIPFGRWVGIGLIIGGILVVAAYEPK